MVRMRVEYESQPIRHIAVQCPECLKWFDGRDIIDGDYFKDLRYRHQIYFANFHCPMCDSKFGHDGYYDKSDIDIEEVYSAEECYKRCYKRKEMWHSEFTCDE